MTELAQQGHLDLRDGRIHITGTSPTHPLLVQVLENVSAHDGKKLKSHLSRIKHSGWREVVEMMIDDESWAATSRHCDRRTILCCAPTINRLCSPGYERLQSATARWMTRQPACWRSLARANSWRLSRPTGPIARSPNVVSPRRRCGCPPRRPSSMRSKLPSWLSSHPADERLELL